MSSATKQKKSQLPSTQKYLEIAEIKDGAVVLKDGTLRAVLLVSSVNFALKSEDEQTALVNGYVGFLNGLDFPLQIVIQSRKLNIDNYLERLDTAQREQTNELLRAQIADYRSFVNELVDIGEIMSKRFYVVVPFDPLSNKKKSFWTRLQEVFSPAKTLKLKEERFQQRRNDLDMRVRQIEGGLASMGLDIARLDTQGLIELYYTVYNPDTFMVQKMGVVSDLRVENL